MNAPTRRLDDVADVQVGFAFKSADFVASPGRFRLLRNDNLGHGQTRWSGGMHLNPAEPIDERYQLRVNDIAVAMDRPWIGSGLKYAVIQTHDLPALLVQRVARLRARPGMSQRYLGYVVAGKSFSNYVRSIQTGTAIPHISASALGAYRFTPGQFVEQEALVEVLTSLDDKIAANAELARTADDLSGAYYSQMLGDANDRPLSSIASFTNGRAFTKGASGTGRVVVRIAELNSGIGPSTVRSNAAVADQYTARAGDILFAWSGSLTVNRWYRPEAIVNQHIFKVEPVDGVPRWLVFRALRAKLSEFRNIAADKATTMGHIQRYHLDDAVSLPDRPEIGARDALMTALWNRALAAEKESLALTELRDTLLPHLMSGRLKVQDAEKTVSDAV